MPQSGNWFKTQICVFLFYFNLFSRLFYAGLAKRQKAKCITYNVVYENMLHLSGFDALNTDLYYFQPIAHPKYAEKNKSTLLFLE